MYALTQVQNIQVTYRKVWEDFRSKDICNKSAGRNFLKGYFYSIVKWKES